MDKGRGNRIYGYILFVMIVLIASWESDITMAAIVNPNIPDQSIRLRILANSDSVEDQWVKRKVRDAVVESMNGWVTDAQSIEEARQIAGSHLDDLRQVTAKVLEQYGYSYGSQVELAVVPFPTKVYGSQVYPAGDYEALRITLGKGKGQNWWCVLFPPLCFVNGTTGDAVAEKKAPLAHDKVEGISAALTGGKGAADRKQAGMDQPAEETHVRFLVVDLFDKAKDFFSHLFA